ncbi:putative inactive lipase [Nocardia sp. RB56]|uniref:Putative inactive lipase n=1 Tax=Nocardia aurantia TaxID=2585199 RepID=A0A7K0DLY8_9NOCA|nr:putative inactive lipase [Nocardia aurantia]
MKAFLAIVVTVLVSPMMLLAGQPATAQPPDKPAPVAPDTAGPSPLQQWIDNTIPAPPLVAAPQPPEAEQAALWRAILSSPVADPTFDAWPAGLETLAPGQVIETRNITATAATMFDAPIARATLVKFRSTSAAGTPSFGTATLLEPAAAWNGPGPRPVEVDTLPINALGLRCTPGYTISHGVRDNHAINVFLPGVATALNKGHTVLVPDHEGPLVAYAEPTVAGHMTLDSIRAIRSLAPDRFGDSRFAVTGYSGGAIASYATAMLLPEYAPELAAVLVGASIGGLVTDYVAVAHVFNGHSASGILLSVALAMSREHPDMLRYMNHLAQWVGTSPLKNICGDADGPLGAVGIPVEVAANIDHPLESGISEEIQRRTDLTGRTSGVPLYIYHGADDFWIPIQGPQRMYRSQCARGVAAEFRTVPGEHVSAMLNGAGGSVDWIDARLRGEPAPNECA